MRDSLPSEMQFKCGQLMGRLANGFESDQGKRIHAVPSTCGHYDSTAIALCGANPGRRSGGWDVDNVANRLVTCPRCMQKMEKRFMSKLKRILSEGSNHVA